MVKRERSDNDPRLEMSDFKSDDGFDDGDDLMARAASMMDFDDDEDSGSEDDLSGPDSSEQESEGEAEVKPSKSKKRKIEQSAGGNDSLLASSEQAAQSVLQLKIDALLASVRCPAPSTSKAAPLDTFVDRLRTSICAIADVPPQPAAKAVSRLNSPLAFTDGRTDLATVNWQLGYTKPQKVVVGGSWSTGASVKWKGTTGWNVDLLVNMPGSIFQEKDVRDHRYFYKRAYYLGVIQDALSASGACSAVTVSYLHSNSRKPILEVHPLQDHTHEAFLKLRCAVRIVPVFDWADSPFSVARLAPSRNNVAHPPSTASNTQAAASPRYNADLALDGSAIQSSLYLQSATARSQSFAQAALLLKVWAHQRGFNKEYGLQHCLYLLTVLLAYVANGGCKGVRSVPSGSSAWHMFKTCIECLARSNFTQALLVSYTPSRATKAPTLEDWQSCQQPVLTDPTGVSNLLAGTPSTALELLQYEAKRFTALFSQDDSTVFNILLLRSVDQPSLRFDQLVRIDFEKLVSRDTDLDQPSATVAALDRLAKVLKKGLNSRARALSIVPDSTAGTDGRMTVNVGIHFEPDEIQRLVEYGPPADQHAEVQAFRGLWGDKAEIRQFKDGKIIASVVWEAEGPSARSQVFTQVVRHLLSRHFADFGVSTNFFATAYDALLSESPQITRALYSRVPESTGYSPLTAAFDYLVKELQGLEGLPLKVTNVIAVSEGLRYTSTFVPGAFRLQSLPTISTAANYVPAHDGHLVFESSGKWPTDLEAIQKIKAAFLCSIATALPSAVRGSHCEVQYDLREEQAFQHCALIITLPQGFTFRFHIRHDYERQIMEDSLLYESLEDRERALLQTRLVRYHQAYTTRPAHSAAIAALQKKHASYSTTARLTKRWLSAHMLGNHLPIELVELVCAKVYIDSQSQYEAPHAGTAGFVRVLHLLSSWNWRTEPLSVPIYTSPSVQGNEIVTFPDSQGRQVQKHFEALRKSDPAMNKLAWVVATEKDHSGRAFGTAKPSKLIAGRVQDLARACLNGLQPLMIDGRDEIRHLFTPDLAAYDFVLHLDPLRVPRHRQAIQTSNKALITRAAKPQSLRPGFDSVQSFMDRAEAHSGDLAVLFYDIYGSTSIGGLFNPAITDKERGFRIALDFASKPTSARSAKAKTGNAQDGKAGAGVALDKQAFVSQLVDMSDGLVESVSWRDVLA